MELVVLLIAVPWALAAASIDVRTRRLPNVLTVPACLLATTAACVGAAAGEWEPLVGAAAWCGVYLVGFVCGGIGAGDVKLAVPLGAAVGWVAGPTGVCIAVVLAQVCSLVAAASARSRASPHGAAMLLAAYAVCVATIW
ncbi:A24 family peptidase [Tsukamurella sp. 8F]|uniref:prepilin peptidase n=1 Tax=unclassified Tsukamurella TaxID=2633480 RepID=UPI0023B9FEE6|nr:MULTISPECIES: A24 family peptidase [unclassified Tsukamurella]MDF0529178.1 A24 family peptidase [Tsukamurella sp. 8J]MDF0585363.1 A24 family peptidase [Tsukamurella sp. 8F]